MSSLNRKKMAKAAYNIHTARFSGVCLIKRGGLPPRISVINIMRNNYFIPCLALLLFIGCASQTTTALRSTGTMRNSSVEERSAETHFRVLQRPNAKSPDLSISVTKKVTREDTFQRRFAKKRVLKPVPRTLLWLGGTVVAAGGYYLMTETGLVMLGKDLIGLGAAVPLGSELVVAGMAPVGEEWRSESRILPATTLPAATMDVVASAGDSSWAIQTDDDGQLAVDVSTLLDMAEPGMPLSIHFALQEDPSQNTTITVPATVLDSHRPTLPVIAATVVEPPLPLPVDISRFPTIAILDFQGIGVSAQEAQVLTNRLGTQMVQLGTYHVIERGQMEQILQEQDFQLTGCTTIDCAVEIGQLIGAQQMLAGSFGKLGTAYTIDMRIIDVATGRILKTTSYDIEGSINRLLSEGLAEAVRRISNTD